jgi:hypothetical protein
MNTLPHVPARSAKARALRAWHKAMNMHMLGITLARLPKFPVIDGAATRRPHTAPRPVMGGAA